MVAMSEFVKIIQEALEQVEFSQLDESSLSRIYQHNTDRNFGTISASRGLGADDPKPKAGEPDKVHTAAEKVDHRKKNLARSEELEGKIRAAGYGLVRLKGHFIENSGTPSEKDVDEKSYAVIGKKGDDGGALLNHLKGWGKEFNQDAIAHKAHDSTDAFLHSTRPEDKEPTWLEKQPDKKTNIGKFRANVRNPDGYSEIKKDKVFSYKE